jgi:hypothetical protein
MVAQAFDDARVAGGALPETDGPLLSSGRFTLPKSDSDDSFLKCEWRVDVEVYETRIRRTVHRNHKAWLPSYDRVHPDGRKPDPDDPESDEMIWPTWPTTLTDELAIEESPLKDLQQRWDASVSRLRDSAKWMATVLGATLVSVIPAASIADLSHQRLSRAAIACGLAGLVCLCITLLLTLQVMRPQSLSYNDIETAKKPCGLLGWLHDRAKKDGRLRHVFESAIFRWQYKVEHNPDLYLPCGIYTLIALRQLMTVEEVTLKALSTVRSNDATVKANLSAAQQARAARLHELHAAAAKIVTMGDYYKVRALSAWTTCLGVLFGLVGIVAIIAAVHWPTM